MNESDAKIKYVKSMKLRCKQLAIEVLTVCDKLQSNRNSLKVILYQLCKSVSSTAANYNAACRARSKKEFFSKISIVLESKSLNQTNNKLAKIRYNLYKY